MCCGGGGGCLYFRNVDVRIIYNLSSLNYLLDWFLKSKLWLFLLVYFVIFFLLFNKYVCCFGKIVKCFFLHLYNLNTYNNLALKSETKNSFFLSAMQYDKVLVCGYQYNFCCCCHCCNSFLHFFFLFGIYGFANSWYISNYSVLDEHFSSSFAIRMAK